jgi:ribosomal protein L37AE/L43A
MGDRPRWPSSGWWWLATLAVGASGWLLEAGKEDVWGWIKSARPDRVAWGAVASPWCGMTALGVVVGLIVGWSAARSWTHRIVTKPTPFSEAVLRVRRAGGRAVALESHHCVKCGSDVTFVPRPDGALSDWGCVPCDWKDAGHSESPQGAYHFLQRFNRGFLHATP